MRVLSGLMALATVAVFLLPSTIAIYAAVNGTAWDLQDLQDLPRLELLATMAALCALAGPPAPFDFAALKHEVTHPVTSGIPLFELGCALIC